MENKLLLILAVCCILAGGVLGWFTRGWLDPRYQRIDADTTKVKIVFDSASIHEAATLRVENARLVLLVDSTTGRTVYVETLFSQALDRLKYVRTILDSLRESADSSGSIGDVLETARESFITPGVAFTDSGDSVAVDLKGTLTLSYSYLDRDFRAGIVMEPFYMNLPVRRTHEIQVVRENFLIWAEPSVVYQGGYFGGGGQVGIRGIGAGILVIPNQKPTYVASWRVGI